MKAIEMAQQIVEVQAQRPIRDRLLQIIASIHTSDGVTPAGLLRKALAEEDQRAVTLVLTELRSDELIEPAKCACVLYHKAGFVLDIELKDGYRLTEKGLSMTFRKSLT
jgi:hypothetical protein